MGTPGKKPKVSLEEQRKIADRIELNKNNGMSVSDSLRNIAEEYEDLNVENLRYYYLKFYKTTKKKNSSTNKKTDKNTNKNTSEALEVTNSIHFNDVVIREVRYEGRPLFALIDLAKALDFRNMLNKMFKKAIENEAVMGAIKKSDKMGAAPKTKLLPLESVKILLTEVHRHARLVKQKDNAIQLLSHLKELGYVFSGNQQEIQPEVNKSQRNFNLDESIAKETGDSLLSTPTLRPTVPPYKPNQVVPIRVTSVRPTYLLAVTEDGYEYEGLLHVSKIKLNKYVDRIEDYFEVGDQREAKILNVDNDGRIKFSTIGMKVPLKSEEETTQQNPSINTLGTNEKLQMYQKQFEETNAQLNTPIMDKQEENAVQVIAQTPALSDYADSSSRADAEYKDLIQFINGIVGAMSPKAKDQMGKVVSRYGAVKFTMKMMEVAQGFETDPGLLFVNEVEKKIGDGL